MNLLIFNRYLRERAINRWSEREGRGLGLGQSVRSKSQQRICIFWPAEPRTTSIDELGTLLSNQEKKSIHTVQVLDPRPSTQVSDPAVLGARFGTESRETLTL